MFTFGFWPWPFGFFIPLIMFVLIARTASRFFRSSRRRYEIDQEGYVDERVRSIESRRSQSPDEARIFKLAYRLKGRITVSDIVVETGLGVSEAESLIQSMVDNAHVRMEVDDSGIVTYEFPEIIRRFESP